MSVVDLSAMSKLRAKLTAPIGSVRVRGVWARGQKDGRWYLRAYRHDAGKELTVWSGRATRAELEAAVHAAMAAPAEAPRPVSWVPQTVGELLAWYVERHQARPRLRLNTKRLVMAAAGHLARELGGVDLLQVRRHHLEDYRDRMGGPLLGYADATVEQHLRTLRTVLRAGVDRGWLARVPHMPELPKSPARVVPAYTPTRDELRAVVEALTGWPRLALAIQVYTGMRISEVALLRWHHIQVWPAPMGATVGAIHLPHEPGAKTGARLISMHAGLLAELQAWQGTDRGPKTQPLPRPHVQPWLLMHAQGQPLGEISRQTGASPDAIRLAVRRWAGLWPRPPGKPREPAHRVLGVSTRTAQDLNIYIAEACAALGIPRFTSHAMRRSMADTMARAGIDVATAALHLGMSPQTLLRSYRRPTSEDTSAAVSRVAMLPETTERVASGDNVVSFKPRE